MFLGDFSCRAVSPARAALKDGAGDSSRLNPSLKLQRQGELNLPVGAKTIDRSLRANARAES